MEFIEFYYGNLLENDTILITEYENEIKEYPNKYNILLDKYFPVQRRQLFQEKTEYRTSTNNVIFNDFYICANFVKHNYGIIFVYFIGNKLLTKRKFIKLITKNNGFRDFIKLSIHIKNMYRDITIKDVH
jgi:hypothetical protein